MARFSASDEHRHRRSGAIRAVGLIDLARLVREVTKRTTALADGGVDAVSAIGLVVPTEALLATMRVAPAEITARATDVAALVATIGRGEPVSPNTEAATRRLLGQFAQHPAGPVAAISLLYQNHDATAALFASTLLARGSGAPRENALARTVRLATDAVRLGDQDVEAGEVVEVSLDGDDMEFGRGDHACPGEAVAVRIVAAMIAAIELLGLTVDVEASSIGPDGRALSLQLTA